MVKLAQEYAQEVAQGKRDVCRWVQLACQRHLNDLDRWKGKDQPYFFDEAAANRVCGVIQAFPHIHGDWASAQMKLKLEPWQAWLITTVFGWKCTATESRRFRVSYTEIPRKNAKSTITSAIGNYLVACDGEAGAHVVSAANTLKQAKLVFTDAQLMARKEPRFLQKFGVEVLAHAIACPLTASTFEALAAEYSNLDGLNLHAALIDELHAHPTRGLWDVLETATGSRSQSLIWAITTAGTSRASVCYDQRSHVVEILNGHIQDESYFGIIYTIDDDDDPWSEDVWFKANPNMEISKYITNTRSEAKRAQHMPSAQNAFFNKHLCIWTNADIAWLPAGSWDRCADPRLDIDDFGGQQCYIALDLARRSDITAMMAVFPPSGTRDWWAVFGYYYLPESTISRAENSHYQGWEVQGHLTATQGPVTDFDRIIEDLASLVTQHDVLEIVFDPFDAGQPVNSIQKLGIRKPIVEVRQSAANMSPAMVEMEGLVLGKRIHHDGDPILSWMVSNTRCRRASGDLIQPEKEAEHKKIDGVTAMLMCINRGLRRTQTSAPRVFMISMED